VRIFLHKLAHEIAGAARIRHSLRPLNLGAEEFSRLGRNLPRDGEGVSSSSVVIARLAAFAKASTSLRTACLVEALA
jgi:hypothetical protein